VLDVSAILTRRRYWACQAVGWGLYLVVTIPQMSAMFGRRRGILEPLTGAALGITLTHAFRAWVRRRDWLDKTLGALLARVIGSSVALAAVFAFVGAAEEFGI
jgi:hypothetical protein